MTSADAAHSALGMYPLPQLRSAWDDLYADVAARATANGIDAPGGSAWDVDPHDSWLDPNLVLGMTCGWPLVTALRERVTVVGTFAYDIPVAGPARHQYRANIIARDDVPMSRLTSARAAINSFDSLSGHISLLEAFGNGPAWPGKVLLTGAHVASIEAVRTGSADVASIDGMTWAFQQRDAPETLEGLVVIGHGPFVPCLPLILGAAAEPADVDGWRAAISAAVHDPAMASVRQILMIRDFVALAFADYTAELGGLLDRHWPTPA
jgi:ABC-type phosphate/phosphonate transport system substrate-binding protein